MLRTVLRKSFLGATITAVLVLALSIPAPAPRIEVAEATELCAPEVEFLGFSDALNKINFGGFAVTELSGIAYDPFRQVHYLVADRSGTVAAHYFTADIPVGADRMGTPQITGVRTLPDTSGSAYTGVTFDGEAIVVAGPDEVIIASEGGSGAGEQPEIRRFSISSGRQLGSLPVPSRFLIAPAGQGAGNLTFESLAFSPSGNSLFTANEVPLSADGLTHDLRNRLRILRYELGPDGYTPAEQYFYLSDPARTATDFALGDLIALNDVDLLVLERGFVEGRGNVARVYRVSLGGAADVSAEPTLAKDSLRPLNKTLIVDLANCPPSGARQLAAQPSALMENYEGMELGPELGNGKRALILISDDNSSATQITRLVALSIRATPLVLPGQSSGGPPPGAASGPSLATTAPVIRPPSTGDGGMLDLSR